MPFPSTPVPLCCCNASKHYLAHPTTKFVQLLRCFGDFAASGMQRPRGRFINIIVMSTHKPLQGIARMQASKRTAQGLASDAAAASAANICIAGFASSVMRLLDLSIASPPHPKSNVGSNNLPLPLMLDTHAVTNARADKSRDGYHYFEQASELTDAAGVEVCVGNSVARVVAQLVVASLCPGS